MGFFTLGVLPPVIRLKSEVSNAEDPKKTLAIDLQEGYVSEDYTFGWKYSGKMKEKGLKSLKPEQPKQLGAFNLREDSVTRSQALGKMLRGKPSEEKLKYENVEGQSPGVEDSHWIKEERCQ
jgi:hypothetical protein